MKTALSFQPSLCIGAAAIAVFLPTMTHAQNRLPGQELAPQGAIVLRPLSVKNQALSSAPIGTEAGAGNTTAITGMDLLSGISIEAGYTALRLDQSNLQIAKPAGVRLAISRAIYPNLAIEAMLIAGARKDTIALTPTVNGEVQLSNLRGIYLKPIFQVTDKFSMYGRVGGASAKIELRNIPNTSTVDIKDGVSGFSWGGGLAYQLTPNWSVSGDYMQFAAEGNNKLSGVNLGAAYRF